MAKRTVLPPTIREAILAESRRACAICGSQSYVQLAHIRPLYLGGESTAANLIVLCPTCHRSVDRITRLSPETLAQIKTQWVEYGRLGRDAVLRDLASAETAPVDGLGVSSYAADREIEHWLIALRQYETFDSITTRIVGELASLRSEDDFIRLYVRPVLEWLGFQGITVLHHTARAEHGKDIVFRNHDRLGGLSFYAVVATRQRVHANSCKTASSGHYAKILDQVKKCYLLPYKDMNLKASFFIDKVVVASADEITEEALLCFREWEDRERRHLVYWSGPTIAGMMLKLQVDQSVGSAQQRRAAHGAARRR